jgi:hypothetical protein
MNIVRVEQILAARGIAPPDVSALVANVNNYSVLLAQPKGLIDAGPSGVHNRDRNSAHAVFSKFIDKAIETDAHIAVTPEYSLPWETLVAALLSGKAPSSGRLWVFGCESTTLPQLKEIKAKLAPTAEVLFESLSDEDGRFLDPLVYVFISKELQTSARRVVLLVQFKTHPMGDPGHFEITHLQRGTSVYQFGGAATELKLVSLICSDAFGFTDADAAQIYDRALVIHIQLNSQPIVRW